MYEHCVLCYDYLHARFFHLMYRAFLIECRVSFDLQLDPSFIQTYYRRGVYDSCMYMHCVVCHDCLYMRSLCMEYRALLIECRALLICNQTLPTFRPTTGDVCYRVATICRLLQILSHFCKNNL